MAVLDRNPPVGPDNEKTGVTRAFSQSIEDLGLSCEGREGDGRGTVGGLGRGQCGGWEEVRRQVGSWKFEV